MKQYLDTLQHILDNGIDKEDRTGTGTRSVFGHQMRFNLEEGFPLLTTKKLHIKSIVHEVLWYLSGSTNIKYLQDNGVRIWNEWADEDGELGPVYGSQWRSFGDSKIDQIAEVIESIKKTPDSRRHIVTAWNPEDLPKQALPPCHIMIQFYVGNGKLSCHLTMRSNDIFLGNPFNIASYALLTHMIAQQCDLGVGDLILSLGDVHIYNNHMDAVKEQLTRTPRSLPKLILNKAESIDHYVFDDIQIVDYDPYPSIKAKVAV